MSLTSGLIPVALQLLTLVAIVAAVGRGRSRSWLQRWPLAALLCGLGFAALMALVCGLAALNTATGYFRRSRPPDAPDAHRTRPVDRPVAARRLAAAR